MQYLNKEDLAALIVAFHRIGQKNLPVILFGAGLPQLAAVSGEAKSYAERLFDYPQVRPLNDTAAADAMRRPIGHCGYLCGSHQNCSDSEGDDLEPLARGHGFHRSHVSRYHAPRHA